jgi:hypothetical protein
MQYANMEDEIQTQIETAETEAERDNLAFQITSLARLASTLAPILTKP